MILIALVLALRVFLPLSGPPGSRGQVAVIATTTPTPSATATATPTPSASATVTASPTATQTGTATVTPTATFPVVAVAPPAPAPPPPPPAPPPATPTPSPTATATATPAVALFVLAGQSNMGLWDAIEVPAAPEDGGLVLAGLRWTAPEPGSTPGTIRVRNGPGLAFARAVARTGQRVGLVGCAVPGTGIRDWQKGQPLYDECLAAVRATGLPVAGLVVYQGEADAARPRANPDAAPTAWAALFSRFVADWRADLGQPDLPAVYARLAHTTSEVFVANWTTVQAQQDAARAPGVIEVDVEPVVLRDPVLDGVHLDDASYDLVGERLAAAWLSRAAP
jgi:hypothetical protein